MIMRSVSYLGFFALLAVTLLLPSCSPDERVIDSANPSWRIIAATAGEPTALALITEPANTVSSTDAYNTANGKSLTGKVTKIAEYRDLLYLLMPETNTIEVVDVKNFKAVATVSTGQRKAIDICFANGTTAFLANDDSTVSVLDITVQRITQEIAVGKKPKAIAAMGNRVGVCNQQSNTISIIDTRSRTVTATIPVKHAPTFIVPDADTTEFVIVSLGEGKIETQDIFTPPYLTTLNAFTASITAEVELEEAGVDPASIIPRGLAVTPAEIAFIPLGSQIIQVDTRNHLFYSYGENGSFDYCFYNFRRQEMVAARTSDATSEVLIMDAGSGKATSRFTLPMTVRAILPYYIQ